MKYLIALCVLLGGCASLPNPDMATMVRADVANRVASFNKLRGVNMPVPEIVFGGKDYGEVFSANSPIEISPELCAKDIEDCLDDTIPHELAHWAIFYYGGYQVKTDIVPNIHGTTLKFYESEAAHDAIWCDTMRAFGGVPEKHGYCH